MNDAMWQAVNNVLTILGPNRPTIIVTDKYPGCERWEWRVADPRSEDTFVAFTGTLYGCLTVQAKYNEPNPDGDLF